MTRAPRAVVGALLPAVAAFALGVLLGPAVAPASAPQPSRTSSAEAAPPLGPADGSGLLELLHRPRLPVDMPGVPVGGRLLAATFHLVRRAPVANLYVAESFGGEVCLVAVTQDERIAATCAPPAALATQDLSLRFSVDGQGLAGASFLLAVVTPQGRTTVRAP